MALFQALLNFNHQQQQHQVLTTCLIQHKLSRHVDTSMSPVQNGIYGTGNTLMTVIRVN
jgi:hypothetical protein